MLKRFTNQFGLGKAEEKAAPRVDSQSDTSTCLAVRVDTKAEFTTKFRRGKPVGRCHFPNSGEKLTYTGKQDSKGRFIYAPVTTRS